jgi:hypothetical protein
MLQVGHSVCGRPGIAPGNFNADTQLSLSMPWNVLKTSAICSGQGDWANDVAVAKARSHILAVRKGLAHNRANWSLCRHARQETGEYRCARTGPNLT